MNLPLQLDRSAPIPLQDQLFEQLRQLILSGRLKPNTRVIATRFLAEQTGVSRRTVLFAYERLIAEGYLETRPAIGTFVSPSLPDDAPPAATASGTGDVPHQAVLFPPTQTLAAATSSPPASVRIDFGPPAKNAATALPTKIWLRRMRDVLDADPEIFATRGAAQGAETLRRVLADYLAATRGILVTPEQVVIVSGRRHACSLVAHLFRQPRVVIEAPCETAVAEFFRTCASDVLPVAVDEHGIDVERLPHGPVQLAYVSPARQNPLGGSLPPLRRAALIEWARQAGAYCIEDDCDSELRYQGVSHPPLAAIDPYGLVFHVGTFANVLGEGLSIGYLLVPPEFVAAVTAAKAMAMESGQGFEQMVVANLIAGGEYDHHLRRLRKTYLERRDALLGALKLHFGPLDIIGAATGTRLTWLLPDAFPPASTVCEAAIHHGVRLDGVTDPQWQASPYFEKALILEYATLTPDVVREGVAVLARVIKTIC